MIITTAEKGFAGFKTVLTEEQESEHAAYIIHMEEILMGLTPEDVRSLAFQMAKRNNITNPFSDEQAGEGWLQGFIKQNPNLLIRMPESTSAAHARAVNRPVVLK